MAERVGFFEKNRSRREALNIYESRIRDSRYIYEKYCDDLSARPCPVCKSNKRRSLDRFHDTFRVSECSKCGTVYCEDTLSEDAMHDYYNNCECNKLVNQMFRRRIRTSGPVGEKVLAAADIVEKAVKQFGTIRVLEVACNSGYFLRDLKQELIQRDIYDNVELFGLDIDESATANPVDPDLSLLGCSIENFLTKNDQKFEVVMHFELIEHLPDPSTFMSSVWQVLVPGGIHYFHTPNGGGLENLLVGYNETRLIAHSIFPPMHLQAFSTQNAVLFAVMHDFNVESITTPGSLDVDIVLESQLEGDPLIDGLRGLSKEQLRHVQDLISLVGGSSHMRVLLSR